MSATTTIVTGGTAPRDVPPARRGFDWGQPFVYLVALVIAAIAVGPVIYVFMGGLRTTADINANPAGLPDPWTLENWIAVLSARELTIPLMLYARDNPLLSTLIWNVQAGGKSDQAAALAVLLMVFLALFALVAQLIARRWARGAELAVGE